MLNLSLLIWLTVLAGVAVFWWHSDLVKNEALKLAGAHCQRLGLQLLDQSMVIKGVFPVRDETGGVCLRRKYRFEFSSTGQVRYQGLIVMIGRRPRQIELEPHVLPDSGDTDSIGHSVD